MGLIVFVFSISREILNKISWNSIELYEGPAVQLNLIHSTDEKWIFI